MQITIHTPSALLGAGVLALAFLVGASSQQATKIGRVGPTQEVRVSGIPDPRTAVLIPNGSPFVVPPGQLLVITGLGRTSISGSDVAVAVDGAPVWFGSITSNAETTHHVPPGLVAQPGKSVSAIGTASVVLGYLVDA